MRLLRAATAEDRERGRSLLQKAADEENSHAQNFIGVCNLNGIEGYPKDPGRAVAQFRLSTARRNAYAMVNLASCYLNGAAGQKNAKKAAELLAPVTEGAADFSSPDRQGTTESPAEMPVNGDQSLSGSLAVDPADNCKALAHYLLGEIFADQNSELYDMKGALKHFVAAATAGREGSAGSQVAAQKAALCLALGEGCAKDMRKANEMLELALRLGKRQAGTLAHGMVLGKQLDSFAQADVEESISQTADQQHQYLVSSIARSLANPSSPNYDLKEAAKWYTVAAEAGDPFAMLSLGLLYAGNWLGAPDHELAFIWFKRSVAKTRIPLAIGNLAICYFQGIGTKKDNAKARALFMEMKDDDLVCYLGSLGRCPGKLLTEHDYGQLVNELVAVADPHALFFIGKFQANSQGDPSLQNQGFLNLSKAAEMGHTSAMLLVALLLQDPEIKTYKTANNASEKAITWLRRGSQAGNLACSARLAYSHLNNLSPNPDYSEAEELYQRCIKREFALAEAHTQLGLWSQRRLQDRNAGTEEMLQRIRAEGIKHLEEADRLGSPIASYALGEISMRKGSDETSMREAYVYFSRATNAGIPFLHRRLAEMHEQGLGVPVTLTEAAYHYRLGALEGDLVSLQRLCKMYMAGHGVSEDPELAKHWMNMLVNQTKFDEVIEIGTSLEKEGQLAAAARFYQCLISLESPSLKAKGCLNLGRLTVIGAGVPADSKKARVLLEQAAALGNREGSFLLAELFIREHRLADAVPILEEAAAEGSVGASFRLGTLLMEGKGGTADPDKGLSLVVYAANRDNLQARHYIVDLFLRGRDPGPDLGQVLQNAGRLAAKTDAASKKIVASFEVKIMERAASLADTGKAEQVLGICNQLLDWGSRKVKGRAYLQLHRLYEDGLGLEKNEQAAKTNLENALGLGEPEALCIQADKFLKQERARDCVGLLLQASKAGYSEADYRLGCLLLEGKPFKKNIPEAMSYLRAAADKQHSLASLALAKAAVKKIKGAPSKDEALAYAIKAYEAGLKEAAPLVELLQK